jgi:hypothetical protein
MTAGCVEAYAHTLIDVVYDGPDPGRHYLDAPLDVLFERIQRRGLEHPPIARDALSRWLEVFQAPTSEEMAIFDKPLVTDFTSTSG